MTSPSLTEATGPAVLDDERADLLAALAKQRFFLRHTARGLDDEQAARRTTVSQLCLGGIVKHVAQVEQGWLDFVLQRDGGPTGADEESIRRHVEGFQMLPGETLAGILSDYELVARATDAMVATLPDLGISHPLPPAPWFEPGARWSARRVILHILAETAQHAGHADIIREALDGAKSMG